MTSDLIPSPQPSPARGRGGLHAQRNTLFVEQAEIISHQPHAAGQYTLRLLAPQIAARAQPGSFVHLSCGAERPMRRPLSIMRADPDHGWIDILYKVMGSGTALLAQRQHGEHLDLIGPIGRPFSPDPQRSRPLLIGGGVGIPPMVFLADRMHLQPGITPLAILGSEVPFPFAAQPSRIIIPGLPAGVIAAMPLLEDWGIPSRLTSRQGYAGCFDGYVTDLARAWLDGLPAEARDEVEVFACGPHAMLEAVAALAREFSLPCQVSLEEFMACAVGGCAGCVVEITTPDGPAMKRVCVDGPVFDARQVFSTP
ncbi:MAG: dihydroorotate dehydrogenase electron transfer subunit [Gammaproteobacteria bacterium]|nr:dihydroorotate dehydrogenase electron transfer subunit [Gammaproteobacteria bacterium]